MAKKRMINGEVPVNEVRQVGEGARGALPPALRATSPAAAVEAFVGAGHARPLRRYKANRVTTFHGAGEQCSPLHPLLRFIE